VYPLVANLLDTVASRFTSLVEFASISVLMAVTVGGVVVLMVPVIGIVAACALVIAPVAGTIPLAEVMLVVLAIVAGNVTPAAAVTD